MNINKQQFSHFIREIVAQNALEELDLYDIDGQETIEAAFRWESLDNYNPNDSPEFKFGLAEAVETIKFVSIVLGTLKTISELTKWLKPQDLEASEIEEKWKSQLISEGLSQEAAETIAQKFAGDLKDKFVKK